MFWIHSFRSNLNCWPFCPNWGSEFYALRKILIAACAVFAFDLDDSRLATADFPDATKLLPEATVVYVASNSMGRTLSLVGSLVQNCGFEGRLYHGGGTVFIKDSNGIPHARPVQALLESYVDEFTFGDHFWSSSLNKDVLLGDSKLSTNDKFRHLFPSWAFFAVVAEGELLVPAFGFESHDGFDWFSEFETSRRDSPAGGDKEEIDGVALHHNSETGLYFFRVETQVFGAFSRALAIRIIYGLNGAIDERNLGTRRLYQRVTIPLERLAEADWDMDVFFSSELLSKLIDNAIQKRFGEPTPILPRPNSSEINYNYYFHERQRPKPTSCLAFAVRMRLPEPPNTTHCEFAVSRALELPLHESLSFLDQLKPLPMNILADQQTFPEGTTFVFGLRDSSNGRLPIAHQMRRALAGNPCLPLTEQGLTNFYKDPYCPEDEFVRLVFMGGNLLDVQSSHAFEGIAYKRGEGQFAKTYEPKPGIEVDQSLFSENGVSKIKRANGIGHWDFHDKDWQWLVWQRETGEMLESIKKVIEKSEQGAKPFDLSILQTMMDEDPRYSWKVFEATVHLIPGTNYFFPTLRDSDLLLRPAHSTIAEKSLPVPEGEKLINIPQSIPLSRVVTKSEFPGVGREDFLGEFLFRIRYLLNTHSSFTTNKHLKEGPNLSTLLIHDFEAGSGIWITKGRLMRIPESFKIWLEQNETKK